MLWILLIVVVAVVVYKFRAPILSKILGHDQGRINRQLNRRKH